LESLSGDLGRQTQGPNLWLLIDNSPRTAPLELQKLRQAMGGSRLTILRLEGEEGDGFARGCNRGFDHLAEQGWEGWVWLLNPDTALPCGDELERLQAKLESLPRQALVGTAVEDPEGRLEASGGWIDPGLDFRRRRLGAALAAQAGEEPLGVDWLSGCSLILQPSAHTPPARFNPLYPLYYEDMDLCLRLAGSGAPLLWLPSPAVKHQRGEGSATPGERRLRLSTLSYLRFLQHHRPGWVRGLRWLRLLGTSIVRLPLQPRRGLAVLTAMAQHATGTS
jgi:GT2 family glycosyltransferase